MSKYVFVIPTLSMGGAERVVTVLSNALVNLGHEVGILTYFGVSDEYPVDERVRVRRFVDDAATYYTRSVWSRLRYLRQSIRMEQPDYVIPFLYHTALATELATIGLHIPIIHSVRNNPEMDPPRRIERFVRDLMVAHAPFTFVQNEAQKRYFGPKVQSRLHVLYNPVSKVFFEVQHARQAKDFTFVTAGRLEEQKNFVLLIRAFMEAFTVQQPVRLVIYGEGSLREELQGLIDSCGYASKITLPGRTGDMASAYSQADAFILSSNYEGMPNALMEAMAAGLPVIATNCPTGPSDLINNMENGLLIPMNDVQAMSEAMKCVYNEPQLREDMATNARQTIHRLCAIEHIVTLFTNQCNTIPR